MQLGPTFLEQRNPEFLVISVGKTSLAMGSWNEVIDKDSSSDSIDVEIE